MRLSALSKPKSKIFLNVLFSRSQASKRHGTTQNQVQLHLAVQVSVELSTRIPADIIPLSPKSPISFSLRRHSHHASQMQAKHWRRLGGSRWPLRNYERIIRLNVVREIVDRSPSILSRTTTVYKLGQFDTHECSLYTYPLIFYAQF
jgi:hypothetical protein